MSDLRSCDKCETACNDVKRYGLQRRMREDGRSTAYGHGSIDLCDKCWERTCRPRMRAYVPVGAQRYVDPQVGVRHVGTPWRDER